MRAHLGTFFAFFIGTSVATQGGHIASAAWYRMPASMCEEGFLYWGADNDTVSNGFGYDAYDANSFLSCPFLSTDTFQPDDVTTLGVYVNDNTSTHYIGAKACWAAFGTSTYSCGAEAKTTHAQTGYVTLNPSLTEWAGVSLAMGYISLWVGGEGGDAHVRGIYAST